MLLKVTVLTIHGEFKKNNKKQEYKNSTFSPLKDESGLFKSIILQDLRHNSNLST